MIWQQIQQYPALARCSEQWQGCEPWQGRFWKPLNRAEADLWWTKTGVRKVPADEKVGQRKDTWRVERLTDVEIGG